MNDKDTSEEHKKENAEKPISLSGASLEEVLEALLKTRPIIKATDKKKDNGKNKSHETKTSRRD